MLDRVELLVVGECVADIVRLPDRADRVHPGGSPANVAYGLARLGRDTTLITQLGPDANGRLIADHLASAGVRVLTDGSAAPTPAATVDLDDEDGPIDPELEPEGGWPEIAQPGTGN